MYAFGLVVFGLLFILFPDAISNALCLITGIALMVIGAIVLIAYMGRKVEYSINGNELVIGVVLVACGVFVITKPDFVISIIPFILGLIVIISGIRKFQDYMDLKKMHYEGGIVMLVFSVIITIFGIILVVSPFNSAIMMLRIIGVGFLISGASDIYSILYMQRKFKQFKKEVEPVDSTAEVIDDTPL